MNKLWSVYVCVQRSLTEIAALLTHYCFHLPHTPPPHPPSPAPAAGSCRLPHLKRIVCLWNNQRRVKWESKWLAWLNGNQVQFFSALLVKTGVFSENNTRLMQNSHFSNNNTVKNRPLLSPPLLFIKCVFKKKTDLEISKVTKVIEWKVIERPQSGVFSALCDHHPGFVHISFSMELKHGGQIYWWIGTDEWTGHIWSNIHVYLLIELQTKAVVFITGHVHWWKQITE